jgi:hypothetical protein
MAFSNAALVIISLGFRSISKRCFIAFPMSEHSKPFSLLVAGLDGLERELNPGPPVNVDPDTLSKDQITKMGIERLPKTLAEALDMLEADPLLTGALGSLLSRSYVAIKRSEVVAYASGDDASQRDVAEFAGHFYKY